MNNKYDLTLGIEIHVQTKTNSKMFSKAASSYDQTPNTNIHQIDLGYPGTKPVVNLKAFEHAICLASELNMDISKETSFDRKHYFYQDLPKGFQITQFFQPIGKNGTLTLPNGNEIKITQIHMEEDTAKQIKKDDGIYLDYNRAGIPLIEIVTDHTTIKTIDDAMLFVSTLRGLLLYHDISDAKMNEGSMRCDINISIKPKGQKELGSKVEVKNINSISNIKLAIEKEVEYQVKTLEANKKVMQSTKRFDDKNNDVVLMREKSDAVDYLYFRETNLPTILVDDKDIKEIKDKQQGFNNFLNDLSKKLDITPLKAMEFINKQSFYLFKDAMKEKIDLKVAYNLFESVIANVINKVDSIPNDINIKDIALLIKHRQSKDLSQQQVGELFEKLVTKKADMTKEIKKITSSKVDVSKVGDILNKIIKDNDETVSQYKERPERVEKFLMGQLMKETKGNINPSDAMKLIKQSLSKIV
jgi:aspartyl-tRNA(Asn)/glutamyl-tRNA(Gln) amidotransferase subunit B